MDGGASRMNYVRRWACGKKGLDFEGVFVTFGRGE